MPRPVDFSPLESDAGGVEATEQVAGRFPSYAAVPAWMVGGVLVFLFGVTTIVQLASGDDDALPFGIAFIVGSVVLALGIWRLALRQERRGHLSSARLLRFARANGITYEHEPGGAVVPGLGRGTDHDRLTWEVDGLPVRSAYNHYRPDSTSFEHRFVAVRLGVGLPDSTYSSGRRGPRVAKGFGPEHLPDGPGSLRHDGLREEPRLRLLFDDDVVRLLSDPSFPCDARYTQGWFIAYYRPRRWTSPERVRHSFALADAVAAARSRLVDES